MKRLFIIISLFSSIGLAIDSIQSPIDLPQDLNRAQACTARLDGVDVVYYLTCIDSNSVEFVSDHKVLNGSTNRSVDGKYDLKTLSFLSQMKKLGFQVTGDQHRFFFLR